MNKKTRNSLIFILCGTIVSILLFLLIGAVLCVLSWLLFFKLLQNVSVFLMACMICVILSLFLGMLVYQKLANWVIEKFNLQDKLDPIFGKKKPYKKSE